jgi:hypothetical protein
LVVGALLGSLVFMAGWASQWISSVRARLRRRFDRGIKVSFDPFAELGRRYDIVERGFKPKRYPCGGLGHIAIDATLELRSEISRGYHVRFLLFNTG